MKPQYYKDKTRRLRQYIYHIAPGNHWKNNDRFKFSLFSLSLRAHKRLLRNKGYYLETKPFATRKLCVADASIVTLFSWINSFTGCQSFTNVTITFLFLIFMFLTFLIETIRLSNVFKPNYFLIINHSFRDIKDTYFNQVEKINLLI